MVRLAMGRQAWNAVAWSGAVRRGRQGLARTHLVRHRVFGLQGRGMAVEDARVPSRRG